MQSQHHLYAASNQSAAAAYQNVAPGYGGPANVNMPPQAAAQYNHVVMMPVNHAMPQPAAQAYAAGYSREGPAVMYGGQPTGMMLTAQPMQQGQRTGHVPQVLLLLLLLMLLLHLFVEVA